MSGLLIAGCATLGAAGAWRGRRRALARVLGLPPPESGWRVRWRKVPGGDGQGLATQHFEPRTRGPHPTILIRTPYGQGWPGGIMGLVNNLYATLLVERGYHVLQQDVRGRFGSEGEYVPFQFERDDGRATLRWIEKQPWFDGRLATFGQSYGGFVQWAIADDPALKAMVPLQTSAEFGSIIHADGSIAIETALRFLSLMDLFGHEKAGWPPLSSYKMLRQTSIVRPAAVTRPVREADVALFGKKDFSFREAIDTHDLQSLFWDFVDHRDKRDKVRVPVLLQSGWLDPFLRETVRDFLALQQQEKQTLLTVGPWTHGFIDGQWLAEVFAWLAHVLKGAPPLPRAAVRYQVVPGGKKADWREAPTWPPPEVRPLELFLRPGGGLGPRVEGEAEPSRFVFDPDDPTPHLGGPLLDLEGAGHLDQRALEARSDVLTFTSEPLGDDVVLAGAPLAHLYAVSDQAHTDFFVRVSDVDESGRSVNVVDGFVAVGRARDGAEPLAISLWPIAWRFAAGHRIRLLVASAAYPRFALNPGTGESRSRAVSHAVQKQTVFHDGSRPSGISLPVLP